MSSSTSKLASKLSAIQKRAKILPSLKDVPERTIDFVNRYKENSAAHFDQSNESIVDVFPDARPTTCKILQLASDVYKSLKQPPTAKISVATIAMYLQAVYYGFFLNNDLHVRPQPSSHAILWNNDTPRAEFADYLLDLPVPDDLATILKQTVASTTDKSKNIFFVPSAAGFQHPHFFGRYFPITFYSTIHDTIANLPSNTSKNEIMTALLTEPLYTCQTTTSAVFTCTIASLLGYYEMKADDNSYFYYYANRLTQTFNSIFNPVLFRDYHRRSNLATLDLKPTSESHAYPNAYDLCLSYSLHNKRELVIVFDELKSILPHITKCSQSLAQVISTDNGPSILEHGYSFYALPTWNSHPKPLATKPDYIFGSTDEEYAKIIDFLQHHEKKTPPSTTLPTPELKKNTDEDPDLPITVPPYPWQIVHSPTGDNRYPSQKDMIQFDTRYHATPLVRVMTNEFDGSPSAHLSTLSGKVIESFELDGTTIPVSNPFHPLGSENSQFAESAIPLTNCYQSLVFTSKNERNLDPPLHRTTFSRTSRFPASSLLIDRTKILLPDFTPAVYDPQVPTLLPGLSPLTAANWIKYTQRFLGFQTVDGRYHAPESDSVPGMTKKLFLWSPYTITTFSDTDEIIPDLKVNRTYFLSNLRTLRGTDFNLTSVKHFLEAIPVTA